MESAEIPLYNCKKQVRAFKIESIEEVIDGANITGEGLMVHVSTEYIIKHTPEAGGYYVRYVDGYESFSPAKAFEEGYDRA